MEEKPDEPEDVTNKPLPSMSEPTEVQDAVASTLATSIITASKSKAQKQSEYRQRITASRTPAQAAAARKSKNERQRNNRLRQAANLAIVSNSLETTTTSPSRSGEESNKVQTRSQRQQAQQQSTTTADQPDESVNLTNEPLFPAIPVPMEVQEAKPTTAPKTRAQIQREYRQRIAASKTPAQVAAAREARNVRDRNRRLRQAANLVIASGSPEATTTSSSRSGQRSNTVHIDTQRQFTDQQHQTLATEPAETIAEVRRKWSHIRNSYSRHLRNEMHGACTSKGRMVSRWYLADELEFLRDHMATDMRPSLYSSYAPTMLDIDMNDSHSAESVDVKPFIHSPWFALNSAPQSPTMESKPPSIQNEDSSSSTAFGPDENTSFFQFFRGIHNDYLELPTKKQRLFKRKCLNFLHELLDEEENHYVKPEYNALSESGVLNLSNSSHVNEDNKEVKTAQEESFILPNT